VAGHKLAGSPRESAVSQDPIPVFDVRLEEADVDAVAQTLRSGWLTMGPRIEAFEAEFARHLGVQHAVATSSATAALHLAYLAAGVGPGDEVIVPGITFVATAAAARYCGARPVLAEVLGQHDLSIDPHDAAARIGPRTKAVCAVHYAGYAAPVAALTEICEKHGLALIEDAAHSPSATVPGEERRLGTLGLAGAFSFFSNKIISCGEGGLLATADDEVATFALGYDVVDTGFNYRMDEPRAALLSARLPRLESDIAERRRLTHRYRALLRKVPGVSLPYSDEQVDASSCYVMAATVDPERRDPLRRLLSERFGIQTTVLYPSIAEFSAYSGDDQGPLPRCERVARSQITLPLYPHLGEERLERVVHAVRAGLEEPDRGGGSR